MQDLHSRPAWDTYFLDLAAMVSRRGTCRVKVGAVVTTADHRLLLSGYAGSVAGEPHCSDVGCQYYLYMAPLALFQYEQAGIQHQGLPLAAFKRRCERTIHGEANIIAIAAAEGIALKGATWYTIPFGPCDACSKLLLTAGAKRVVYPAPPPGYDHYRDAPILTRAGVQVEVVSDWCSPLE